MFDDIKDIFDKITERYQTPIKIGSKCLSRVFYRIEYITDEDMATIAQTISDRIEKVCSPQHPDYLISLPGNHSELDKFLALELGPFGDPLEIIPYDSLLGQQDIRDKIKNKNVVLVNDIITTARSCLEAHSMVTLNRASVLCWAALIDRTFGPGPVSIVASLTGEPVTLL